MNVHAIGPQTSQGAVSPASVGLALRSAFPADAHAVIYRPARAATTSGKARTRDWKLRFERRTAPRIEPLMGWTAGDDPLTQIELSFPSAESAIAYARRQGLHYTVRGLSRQKPELRLVPDTGSLREQRRWRLEWVERTLGRDVIRNGFGLGAHPAESYADPQDVLSDPGLSEAQKRDVLRRWALDAYLIELASQPGDANAAASRLPEVISALIGLDAPRPGQESPGTPPSGGQARAA